MADKENLIATYKGKQFVQMLVFRTEKRHPESTGA